MVHCQIAKAIGAVVVAAATTAVPALAHKTEMAGDVAATWHIDPNDTPKAGEPARAWVALTRRGGEVLPLDRADCQMDVYAQPRQADDRPLLQPPLQAIAAEQYQGIPGADLVFPQVGLYQLELACTPKTAGEFEPFQFQHEVTVASGTTPPLPTTAPTATDTPSDPASSPADRATGISGWMVAAVVTVALVGGGVVGWRIMKHK